MPAPMRSEAARAAEAAVILVIVGVMRRLWPMTRWRRVLGTPGAPDDRMIAPVSPPTGLEADVGLAVGRACARLPWRTTCLDRAAAAQMMLRRRGQPGVVVIGLAPREGWGAHAWLVGATGIVVGGSEAARFAPATIFR